MSDELYRLNTDGPATPETDNTPRTDEKGRYVMWMGSKVDTGRPPPLSDGVVKWVRGTSPWHAQAFPSEFADQAPDQATTPTDGWLGEDWCGNVIGFHADDTNVRRGYRTFSCEDCGHQ